MATRIVDVNAHELLVDGNGAITVQPGNTANTTAWKVDGSAVTQPISMAAASSVNSAALEASHVIKAAAGTLYTLNAYNDNAAAQYIQIHNAAALPANGAVPAFVFSLATKAVTTISFDLRGKSFATGIVVCNSSTAATKTIGAADCWFDAEYT